MEFRQLLAAVCLLVAVVTTACRASAPPPSPTVSVTSVPAPTSALEPTPAVHCIAWYNAPEHVGETTCVEGRILQMRNANAPRFAFMLFDPTFSIDDCCGDFYAWIVSEDWCEYFSDCRQGPGMSTELDGRCVRVHGTIEQKMGRIRIEVTHRSQIEFVDCDACQIPDACVSHPR